MSPVTDEQCDVTTGCAVEIRVNMPLSPCAALLDITGSLTHALGRIVPWQAAQVLASMPNRCLTLSRAGRASWTGTGNGWRLRQEQASGAL